MSKTLTVPSYQMVDTTDPNVKRFCDREGNWTHYFLVNEKRFVKAVNHILRRGYPKGDGLYQWLKNTTADEADRRLKTAGEEGSRTHEAIRDLAAGLRVNMSTPYQNDLTGRKEPLNDEEWDNLQGYINFSRKYQMKLISEEFVVASSKYGYAGTADRLARLFVPEDDKCFPKEVRGQWVVVLLDWKTSSKLWPEYALQISAYWHEIVMKKMFIEYIDHNGPGDLIYGMLVRLGTGHKEKFEVKVFTPTELSEKFRVFESCIVVANDQEPTYEPVVEEIPMEFYHPIEMAAQISREDIEEKRQIGDVQIELEHGTLLVPRRLAPAAKEIAKKIKEKKAKKPTKRTKKIK